MGKKSKQIAERGTEAQKEAKEAKKEAKKAKGKVPEVSVDDARRMLVQEQQSMIQTCVKEVNAVLAKHGCMLDASMVISARGTQPQIRIIPRPPKEE